MNHDLQASHQLLTLLEVSKSKLEQALDRFPGIFLVLDRSGRILKCNIEASKALGLDPEDAIGSKAHAFFSAERAREFQDRLQEGAGSRVEFELEMDGAEPRRQFLWEIQRFAEPPLELLAVTGRDITDFKRAFGERLALAKDLEITKAVQTLLLPKDTRFENGDFTLNAYYRSADQSGGDWWWAETRKDGSLLVLLGDVTGHGAGSAMVTSSVAGCFKALSLGATGGRMDVEELLRILNGSLHGFCEGSYWMTLTVLEISPAQDEIRLWFAGSPPSFVMRPGQGVDTVALSGMPIGVETLSVRSTVLPFPRGSRALVYTDGVCEFLEGPDSKSGILSLKRLCEETRGKSADAAHRDLVERLESGRKERPGRDDAAFVLVDRL